MEGGNFISHLAKQSSNLQSVGPAQLNRATFGSLCTSPKVSAPGNRSFPRVVPGPPGAVALPSWLTFHMATDVALVQSTLNQAARMTI